MILKIEKIKKEKRGKHWRYGLIAAGNEVYVIGEIYPGVGHTHMGHVRADGPEELLVMFKDIVRQLEKK